MDLQISASIRKGKIVLVFVEQNGMPSSRTEVIQANSYLDCY